jgi:hypothetical protein
MAMTAQTLTVVERHWQALVRGDVPALIADYADDAILISGATGIIKRRSAIGELLEMFVSAIIPAATTRFALGMGSECFSGVAIAPVPLQLFPKSLATPALLAHIATAKFVDGIPLYRQEGQFDRLGVPLGRATMAGWMIRLGGTHIVPTAVRWKRRFRAFRTCARAGCRWSVVARRRWVIRPWASAFLGCRHPRSRSHRPHRGLSDLSS